VPFLAQSIVPGPDTNMYEFWTYVDQQGTPLVAFEERKLRQFPPGFGEGALVESVDSPELRDVAIEFLRRIDYRGMASLEFKRDTRDGGLKLIELNPRIALQNSLATTCGVNLPLLQYLDLTGQSPQPVRVARPGVKWLNVRSDFRSFREYRR